jgi:mRNA interferase RelE/StbE
MQIRTIDISKAAGDFLLELPAKQCKQNFTAIMKLTKNPQPQDAKKLQGYKDLYRIDVGEYRIIYRFDDQTVYIALAGKRNDDDVYKKLKRK